MLCIQSILSSLLEIKEGERKLRPFYIKRRAEQRGVERKELEEIDINIKTEQRHEQGQSGNINKINNPGWVCLFTIIALELSY